MANGLDIQPSSGKLGVLTPGMGAVSSTFIAGVEAIRRGIGQPTGSLTQMAHVRLGKRTEGRQPLVKDFVPLAGLDDLVFGGWDIFPDSVYEACLKAGVLDPMIIEQLRPDLEKTSPMPAVFDNYYVKKLDGSHVKSAANKMELAEALIQDMRDFKAKHNCDRLVMIWCGSTEIFLNRTEIHESLEAFERGLVENHADIAPSHVDRDADMVEHLLGAEIVHQLEAELDLSKPTIESPHVISQEP